MSVSAAADEHSTRAMAAAVAVARGFGIRSDAPVLLKDGANVLLHLRPAPVVARIATTTALVRQPAGLWLKRDLDVAAYLHALGAPVVAPARELPPGPHQQDGFAISFWTWEEHEAGALADGGQVLAMLEELHEALRGYPGELPRMGTVAEVPGWIAWCERHAGLTAADADGLRAWHGKVTSDIDALAIEEQPLHGDAHRGNLLKTPRGLLWTDFEDACRGPRAVDLACLLKGAGPGIDAVRQRVAYSAEQMAPFLEARELIAVAWYQVLAVRFLDRKARAADLLNACRRRASASVEGGGSAI